MMDLEIGKYGNMLSYLNFTLEDVENQLKQHPKILIPHTGDDLNRYRLPTFIKSFYSYILQTEYIPSILEFIGYYSGLNIEWLKQNLAVGQYPNLRSRLSQMFNSLIREFHFAFAIKQYLPGLHVLYNIQLDLEYDIDLLIELDGKYYALALFTDSKNSLYFRKKKESRHVHFNNVKYLEMPFRKEDGLMVGIYNLYNIPEIAKNLFPALGI